MKKRTKKGLGKQGSFFQQGVLGALGVALIVVAMLAGYFFLTGEEHEAQVATEGIDQHIQLSMTIQQFLQLPIHNYYRQEEVSESGIVEAKYGFLTNEYKTDELAKALAAQGVSVQDLIVQLRTGFDIDLNKGFIDEIFLTDKKMMLELVKLRARALTAVLGRTWRLKINYPGDDGEKLIINGPGGFYENPRRAKLGIQAPTPGQFIMVELSVPKKGELVLPEPTGGHEKDIEPISIGNTTELEGKYQSYAEANKAIRKASKEDKIALLRRGGTRTNIQYIILHDGGRYGKYQTGVNSLLTDWALRNAHFPNLPECQAGSKKILCKKVVVSSHYYVDCDGTTTPLVPEANTAYHAGCKAAGKKCYLPGINKKSIGIDIRNCKSAAKTYVTDEQYEATNTLIDQIISRHPKIKRNDDHILAHFEVYSGHNDPLPAFNWEKVKLANHRSNNYCIRNPTKGMCHKKASAVAVS